MGADENGDGTVDLDEWMRVCEDPWVQAWLTSQEIRIGDAVRVFRTLDDGDGKLTADELINGTVALKGGSANMDLMALIHSIEGSVNDIKSELFAQQAVAQERLAIA